MKFNPDIHHRRSIRLKDYDYSQAGAYFVTICTKDKEYYFGNIADKKMELSQAGRMIQKWWVELIRKFTNIELDEFIVMPNHMHGIIVINNVGADLHVCPGKNNDITDKGEHTGSPLHRVIQWLKTMTTNEYIAEVKQNGWARFNGKLWQRNYYEHIIRKEEELNRIREYIANNPLNWETDENYKESVKYPEPKDIIAEVMKIK